MKHSEEARQRAAAEAERQREEDDVLHGGFRV